MVSLHEMTNLPTVLQSLGCIGRYSPETFDDLDAKITPFINEKIFHVLHWSLDELLSASYDPSNRDDLKNYKCFLHSFVDSITG